MGRLAIQHHRAHVASVLAERGELDHRVVGIALDGTGFGDDGSIWGGEFFVGSVSRGLDRVASLAPAMLAGGDAAARHPVQAAAGFLAALDAVPDLHARPFAFPDRFRLAQHLIQRGVRTVPTTSTGRLFDAVAALTGFTRAITFEGQAGMWLEHLARGSSTTTAYAMPFDGQRLDWRPALDSILRDRVAARDPSDIARAFHRGLARGLADAVLALLARYGLDTVVLSGGVIQNSVLVSDFVEQLDDHHVRIWINQRVPPNDGGLSLGQAALAVASNGGAS
jgi:hydrogenase maturation protein HypF